MALLLGEQRNVADALVGEDPRAGGRDPVERVDRRQELHHVRFVARLALLARKEVRELVERVDDHLRRAPHVARAVLELELRPERLHLGHVVDHRLHLVGRDRRHRADALAGGRVERLELGRGGPGSVRRLRVGRCLQEDPSRGSPYPEIVKVAGT